jgi:hypothetical protein
MRFAGRRGGDGTGKAQIPIGRRWWREIFLDIESPIVM